MRADVAVEVLTRLKRARGQLNAVVEMTEDGRDRREALIQLAAASKAVNRAAYKIILSGTRRSNAARARGEQPEMTDEELEELFHGLA